MKSIRVFIFICLMAAAWPVMAEQVSSESEIVTSTLPVSKSTDATDVISYTEFKLLLESGKIKTVNLVSQTSDVGGSCFPDYFAGPSLNEIGGIYVNTNGKERTFATQRTSQASNDIFLIDAIRARNISISIKKENETPETCETSSGEWTVWDDVCYAIFDEPTGLLVLTLVIVCITLYQVVRLKRKIIRLKKQIKASVNTGDSSQEDIRQGK